MKKVKFDYDRWKSGDYLKVVTGLDTELLEFTEFKTLINYPLIGSANGYRKSFTKKGHYLTDEVENAEDLFLIVADNEPIEFDYNIPVDNNQWEATGNFIKVRAEKLQSRDAFVYTFPDLKASQIFAVKSWHKVIQDLDFITKEKYTV
jgi:hypothetical protein